MIRVTTKYLQPGMTVARTIYNADGKVLLARGMVLTQNFIDRIFELEIASVYIDVEDDLDLASIPEVISEQNRIETTRLVKSAFDSLETNRRINVQSVRKTIDNVINDVLSNRDVLFHLAEIRSYDDYTFSHSVNVCILSLMSAITLGYNYQKLRDLGMGALLHDVGKTKIGQDILKKPGDLIPEEFSIVREHPQKGYDILRSYPDIPLLSAHVCLQHHERWDGKGYPRRLAGDQIHEHARICAVADVYDALMSDRPYRPGYSVDHAVTIINRMSGTFFEPRAAAALVANIAIFPLGSVVMISTGQVGVVVDVTKQSPTRPVIKVLYDQALKKITAPREVDLTKLSTVFVSQVLSDTEILSLIKGTLPSLG